ncbi:S41 family peptidase [Desulfocurvus vexinensis]|uniref:S41 family peptidase n=1 Tax=Desulfocurvus vexinensis TaxID=399548 RepID=UPI000490429E|nr:S41 family peptidase [Desulfocurvus vexinensis]
MRFAAWLGTFLLLALLTLATPPSMATQDDPYAALGRFSDVLDLVEKNYVHEVTRDELVNGAIKGMLEQLDPHSTYMEPEEFQEMQIRTTGEFGGIGIEITLRDGRLTVIAPIEDTPAFEAGLKSGDIILEIDGQSTQGISLLEAVNKIRGPKGSTVSLTLIHQGETKPYTVSIKRATIPIRGAKSNELEPGYLYLRLMSFNENTTKEMRDAISDYTKKNELKGIVLDMRGNPGGLLNQAVAVADTFLSGGNIVYIKGRDEASRENFDARPSAADVAAPMVVLINAGSASASEIVAGALQDRKRALILGERSFGKATVQTIIPLSDGSGIKLTKALYYTPGGRSIQAEGIVPDIVVPFEEPGEAQGNGPVMREKDMRGHIEVGGTDKPRHGQAELTDEVRLRLERDNQLRMALQFVKKLPDMGLIGAGK